MSIVERVGAKAGDLIFFGAGHEQVVSESMAHFVMKSLKISIYTPKIGQPVGSLTFLCLKMMVMVV